LISVLYHCNTLTTINHHSSDQSSSEIYYLYKEAAQCHSHKH